MHAIFDFIFSDFNFQDLNLPRTNADQFSIANVEEGMIIIIVIRIKKDNSGQKY